MATLGIERRIERLEKELGMTEDRVLVIIRRFGLGDGEVTQFRCGDRFYDRLPGETERAFEDRTEHEILANREHQGLCVVMVETRYREPTLRIPAKKGEQHGAV